MYFNDLSQTVFSSSSLCFFEHLRGGLGVSWRSPRAGDLTPERDLTPETLKTLKTVGGWAEARLYNLLGKWIISYNN